jgi:hypothetical protein
LVVVADFILQSYGYTSIRNEGTTRISRKRERVHWEESSAVRLELLSVLNMKYDTHAKNADPMHAKHEFSPLVGSHTSSRPLLQEEAQ